MTYDLIKYYYESGVYDIKQVSEYVRNETITEEEFHSITGYSYSGINKERRN